MNKLIDLTKLPICSLLVLVLFSSCSGENGEQDLPDEITSQQPAAQEQSVTTTPIEYARTAEAVDWTSLELERQSVWQRDIAHIGVREPIIVESPDVSVVIVHVVNGVAGLALQDGSQLWAYDLPVYKVEKTQDYTVVAFTTEGFAVEIDPVDGSILNRYFHGHTNQSDEWGSLVAYAEFSPVAVKVGRNSIALLRGVEISEDAVHLVQGEDLLIVADRHRFSVVPQKADEAGETRFGVDATGTYEVFGVNFDDVPAVFRVLSDSEDVLAENQEYGAMLDGFSLRLIAGEQYKIAVDFLPDAPDETALELMITLLSAE